MGHSAYNKNDPKSIERFGQNAIGKTFQMILDEDNDADWESIGLHESDDEFYSISRQNERKHYKGKLGQLIEEKYFHYECNSDSSADFKEAGVELKVTPYKKYDNGRCVAKERVSLTMINYMEVINEPFFNSHLWQKCRLILFMWYRYNGKEASALDQSIDFVQLFTPDKEDLAIIKHDYEIIVSKIKEGKAHELSEADTMYLGAATKSANSSVTRPQPFSTLPARQRAFTYKNSYMTYLLNSYFIPGKKKYERINDYDSSVSFESYVESRINAYRGWTLSDLIRSFGLRPGAKNIASTVAFRILGIKGNNAEEFVKANIVVKTIRINKNNRITENMSFPAFRFNEIVNETWEDSSFGDYMRETKFLFVVYKYDESNILHLQGCQFWNIPYEDLEEKVRSVWEKTVEVIKKGLKIEKQNGRNQSNLPKAKDNWICHVRPHARDSKDTDVLPDGRLYPKQCFWLSNKYIYQQINDSLK